ncbi:type IV pilus assembly PilZ [Methylocaldum marinum]|uniref:Type IV pilus assembly PilZ n=1 Tax=Methylocaldum marinum TaxID=1432792 RepID=A0A250L039_9GAMM|nr:type IV pilus assembly PilZ [Methylocaldum marinum]
MLGSRTNSGKERRRAPRLDSRISAYLIMPSGAPLRGVARNISRSGVFIETQRPLKRVIGEPARLVFTLEHGNLVRLARYSVVVVRESQHGIGLGFWKSSKPAILRKA